MGAWSAGSFGNDAALDFVDGLGGPEELTRSLAEFGADTDHMDADRASAALAACDLLAASIGRPAPDLPDRPEVIDEIRGAQLPRGLPQKARAIVKRVRRASELAELWGEDDDTEWQEALEDLLARLTPSRPYRARSVPKTDEFPDDLIGCCYICYGLVTARDGLLFEHEFEGGITGAIYPHRKCIEDQLPDGTPGPHWTPEGAPMPHTRAKLMQGLGIED